MKAPSPPPPWVTSMLDLITDTPPFTPSFLDFPAASAAVSSALEREGCCSLPPCLYLDVVWNPQHGFMLLMLLLLALILVSRSREWVPVPTAVPTDDRPRSPPKRFFSSLEATTVAAGTRWTEFETPGSDSEGFFRRRRVTLRSIGPTAAAAVAAPLVRGDTGNVSGRESCGRWYWWWCCCC